MDLTVAVCTYRRHQWLKKCLDALAKQTLSRDSFRVVVVDNSLQPEVSEQFRKQLPQGIDIEFIVTEKSGLSYARNVALAKANTPYIAYLDDDAIPAPDWADAVLSCFSRHQGFVGVVGGKTLPLWEGSVPDWLTGQLLHPYALIDWGENEFVVDNQSTWLVGANITYLTTALRAVGGFDERLGRKGSILLCHEEMAVNNGIAALGLDALYTPHAVVQHAVQSERLTVDWLLTNSFWEGFSRYLFETKLVAPDFSEAQSTALETDLKAIKSKEKPALSTDEILKAAQNLNIEGRRCAVEITGSETLTEEQADEVCQAIFVVTPCLNVVHTLDDAIESVVSQAGDFFIRYHVQDGASTDGTIERLKEWQSKLVYGRYRLRCKGVAFSYSSEPDNGMYSAISKGFAQLNAPEDAFMTWLNADDLLMQGAFATVQGAGREHHEIEWITGMINCIRANGGLADAWTCAFPRKLLREGYSESRYWKFVQQEGTFWRARLWRQVGGLNRELRLAGDFDLWRRFSEFSELWVFFGALGAFRLREGQLSSSPESYHAEIDTLCSKKAKDANWETVVEELASRKYEFYGLKYDWNSHSYQALKLNARDYSPIPLSSHSGFPEKIAALDGSLKSQTDTELDSLTAVATELESPSVSAPPTKKPLRVGKLGRRLQRLKDYRLLSRSGVFMDRYYLDCNPDVARSGIDPLLHYLRSGWQEGRNPHPLFSTVHYLRGNPDVEAAGINPLVHYVRWGYAENRATNMSGLRLSIGQSLDFDTLSSPANNRPTVMAATPVASLTPASEFSSKTQLLGEPMQSQAAPLPTIENFEFYTYSKRSHLPILASYAQDLYGYSCPDFDEASLKLYQDLLAYAFIRLNIPPGSRILEIGGGHSRVLERLSSEYECWNADRFEGIGDGPTNLPNANYRIVREFIGAFSPELPENYFDFVFSISVLEHLPTDNPAILTDFLNDIVRIKKADAIQLHLIDHAINTVGWQHPILPILTEEMRRSTGVDTGVSQLAHAADLYHMSERAYNTRWLEYTKIPFSDFGHPVSMNLMCRNTEFRHKPAS